MTGHCPVCNGSPIDVIKATKPGDPGHSDDNEAANHRLIAHQRDDSGGDCCGSDLPPDSLN